MSPSFDPEQLPVVSIDTHLPAVPSERMTPAALGSRFRHPPDWLPEIAVEPQLRGRSLVPAAVLMPLVMRDGLSVLLTRRAAHLTDHPGQISFPGGRVEATDASAIATALRETNEEIGLLHDQVCVLGTLSTYTTATGYIVTPVVALVEPAFELNVDPLEVAEVFEVPLAFLMTPAHHQRQVIANSGPRREFFSMRWSCPGSDGLVKRYFIWGATAAMLRNFLPVPVGLIPAGTRRYDQER